MLQVKRVCLPPEQHGEFRLTKAAVTVRIDIGPLHAAWVTPTDVLVEYKGEKVRRPVVDVTRFVQAGLVLYGALLLFVAAVVTSRKGGPRNDNG
jgi:hypothetical protein